MNRFMANASRNFQLFSDIRAKPLNCFGICVMARFFGLEINEKQNEEREIWLLDQLDAL